MIKKHPYIATLRVKVENSRQGQNNMWFPISSLLAIFSILTAFLVPSCFVFSAHAKDYDEIIVLNDYAGTSHELKNSVIDKLSASLKMALSELEITHIDPRFSMSADFSENQITSEMAEALKEYEEGQAGRLLVIEVSAAFDIAMPELIVPRVSITDVGTGSIVAVVTTLPILPPFNLPNIDAGAAALARSIAKRLDESGYIVGAGRAKPWGRTPISVRIALEGFAACDQQALLTTIEEEFPGFLGLELEKAPNPTYAIYKYETTASKERLKKWVQLLIAENGAWRRDVVRLYVQGDDFRLQKNQDSTLFKSLCGD